MNPNMMSDIEWAIQQAEEKIAFFESTLAMNQDQNLSEHDFCIQALETWRQRKEMFCSLVDVLIIQEMSEIKYDYYFNGDLRHGESALLTDSVKWEGDTHIVLVNDADEAVISEVGSPGVRICSDHWARIGRLMGWTNLC